MARVAPAGAVPTAVAMPMDGAYGFPARGANPDLPDAIEAWNGLRALMTGYMAASVVMLFFSIWVFPISLPPPSSASSRPACTCSSGVADGAASLAR